MTTLPLPWVYYKSFYALFSFSLQLCVTAFVMYGIFVLTLWFSELLTKQKVKALFFNNVMMYILVTWLIIFVLFAVAPTPHDMAFHYSKLF